MGSSSEKRKYFSFFTVDREDSESRAATHSITQQSMQEGRAKASMEGEKTEKQESGNYPAKVLL